MTPARAALGLLLGLCACSSAEDRCLGGVGSAAVTVLPETAGRLAPGFVGLSFEKSHLSDAFFTGGNARLIALFRLLGPGVVRIGANDVDVSVWQPDAPFVPGGTTSNAVGTIAVDGLADFLDATGWRAIYGVNLKTGSPAAAVAEATYVTTRLGDRLLALELGNEVNFYPGGYAAIRALWEATATTIQAALPAVPLAAPATAGDLDFATAFARDEGARLALLTHHYYRGHAADGTASLSNLLAPDRGVASAAQTLAIALPGGFRWGEVNSYAGHGVAGISDAFASALWGIDFMLTSATAGASGVNFHGGGQNMDGNVCVDGAASCTRPFRYAPIVEVDSQVAAVAPLYDGLLFVSQMGHGELHATRVIADGVALSAYALGAPDGSTVVALINKDARCGLTTTVDLGAPVAGASALVLAAPSLSATEGVTLGGAAVTPAGDWQPLPPLDLPAADQVVTVDVAAATAVLLRASP